MIQPWKMSTCFRIQRQCIVSLQDTLLQQLDFLRHHRRRQPDQGKHVVFLDR